MTADTTQGVPDAIDAEKGINATYTKGDDSVNVKQNEPLIGLTKEELEKYRNNSFWKPLRLILFALFWVAWIAMFGGAILIVVLSPKCAVKKAPEWWRTKVSYQVFTPSFRDSNGDGTGDFKGIGDKVDALRKIGVKNIWATPVIATHKDDFSPYDVMDFTKVDDRFGTMDDFKQMIGIIHDYDLHFVMDLPIATTSVQHPWFEDAKKGGEHKKFYVWKKQAEVTGDSNYVPLANSQEAFFSYNGKDPVLNWENPAVRQAMLEVAKQYVELGVDGFHLSYINQLTKQNGNAEFKKTILEALEGFKNDLQKYVEENESIKERNIVVFGSLNDIEVSHPHDPEQYNAASLEYIVDDSIAKLDENTCPDGVAKCLYNALTKALNHFELSQLPHVWQFTNFAKSRPTSRFGEENGNLMTFVQMTLPGAVEVYYGQDIGLTDAVNTSKPYTGLMQWDDSKYGGFTSGKEQPYLTNAPNIHQLNYQKQYGESKSTLKTFKTLAKMRQRDDNLAFGAMKLAPLENNIIKYSRVHHDGESTATIGAAYVVVTNFGSQPATININSMVPEDRSSKDVEVAAVTAGVEGFRPRDKLDLSNHEFELPAHQGILLKL